MSEKVKPEKWEKKDWLLSMLDRFPEYKQKGQKRPKTLKLLPRGKLVIGEDKFSIEDFSLNYVNIIRIEIWKGWTIAIQDTDANNYSLGIYWTKIQRKMLAIQDVYSILLEKVNQFKEERASKAIEIIKTLPKLYKEISLDELTSRTGLLRADSIKIIETLILDDEIKAEIKGEIIKFGGVSRSITTPIEYETKASIQETETKEGLLIFVSYATKDANLYRISELAHKLESYDEIGEVLYWQEDMHDNIIEYMNDNLGKCDVVLLFCSPNALSSVPVKKEWMAAESLNKPIIPIFVKPEHIPPLLNDRLGIEFDSFNFQKNIQGIYELVLKKKQR